MANQYMADGILFPSKSQRDRYLYLKSLQQQGVISNLDPNPPSVELIPAQRTKYNAKLQRFSYTPDFSYEYSGVSVVEEHKPGFRRDHNQRYWSITLKLIEWLGVYDNFYVSRDVSGLPSISERRR